MIERERLEDLIEQGAIIYRTYANVCVQEIKLNKANIKTDGAFLWQKMSGAFKGCGIPLDQLFETKEDAEWHKEFKRIPRTDYLDLPTWEEFLKMKKLFSFNSKKGKLIVYFYDNKTIFVEDEEWNILREPLTKENYLKACRKCKELFLGE